MIWMKRVPLAVAAVVSAISAVAFLADRPAVARDPDARPIVVELFTSQGCHSCPPADAYLGILAQRDDVIALAHHVDYWNYIGWNDPFSSPAATARQHAYARAMRSRTVYTPQMVIDGRYDAVGSRRYEVDRAIDRAANLAPGERIDIPVTLSLADGGVSVVIEAGDVPESADIVVIAFDDKHVTPVPRGENAGRTLEDFNVVRGLWRLGGWSGEKFEASIDVAALSAPVENLVVLLQERNQGPIYGAASIRMATPQG